MSDKRLIRQINATSNKEKDCPESDKDKYKASRIIKDTLEAKLIKPVDENTAPRYMKYIPFWA